MEIQILGPLRFAADGRVVPVGGWRTQTVLAALALEADRTVLRDRLIDVVWGANPPASARTQIAISVSALRREIGRAGGERRAIETVPGGYRLSGATVRLDVLVAGNLVRAARAAPDDATAVPLYREALELWRGPVLAGLSGTVMETARRRWDETRLAVVDGLAAAELRRGGNQELTGVLMSVLAEHPHREGTRARLMTALWFEGRRAEALAVYREGHRVLNEELGLDPGYDLRELHQAILRGDPADQVRLAAVPHAGPYELVRGR